MRILFLTNHLNGGDGYSEYNLCFIRKLQRLGHKVLVLTSKGSRQTKIKESTILKSPLKYLVNPLHSFLTAFKVGKVVEQFSPDIIHFTVEAYASTIIFLKTKTAKTVLTVHGTYSVIPILYKGLFKRKVASIIWPKVYNKINRVVAVSDFTKKHLTSYYPEVKTKIRVITNGIDLEKHKIIDLVKKPKNKVKKILFVGAIKHRKGILEAIESLKIYRDNFSDDFIYDIVGDYNKNYNYYQDILKKIKDYKLEGKVFFRGKIDDSELQKYYSNTDLFLMLSINIDSEFEGFGLVYLEANSKGVPCIGPKNCGAQEAILDGKTGYIVDPYSAEEVAKKIDLVLNKNSIKVKDCIEWAKQNDIKIKTEELVDFYQEMAPKK